MRSEATDVPGNAGLSAAARAARERLVWSPYHAAIISLLDARAAAGRRTVYVSIHSFTPVFLGQTRAQHVAVLSRRDRRLADSLLIDRACDPALCVGDNIPYRMTDEGDYGVPVHAEGRGLPCTLLEIRQDQIALPEQPDAWADRLAPLLAAAARRLGD